MVNFSEIEEKWQKKWENLGIAKMDPKKPKFFMHFAYPGISGYQHIGHMRGFSYTDIICRYKRMKGYNVFFPVGTHASGNQAMGFANKVKNRNENWIEYLKANGFPMENLSKMEDVKYVVNYFNQNYQENWKKFGFLADFTTFTCTIYPEYNKFIQWQFRKLKEKGLLIQKPYYGTFCPNCGPVAVDPSETDLSKGGNAEKYEYTLLKFKLGKEFLVAATLRPETIYGQTNLWVDPNQEYVKVKVNEEIWICSSQCAEKLKYQKDKVEVIDKFSGKELIDKKVNAPGIDREIPILPSKFVDPNIGTGIVTSVPSDAPYDWMALYDLQKEGKYKDIKVIPIINSKDWGDTPAIKICEKMKIKDQNDPKLEEATKEIYKIGFHTGTMNKNCGKYAGLPVEKAKEEIKKWLIEERKADIMYDLSEEVICRCGKKVVIKLIPDAWFIDYGNKALKEKSKEHAKTMNIMPVEYKNNIDNVIDWFQERACARLGNWLGTKLPFDEKWIIEPISDSTIYSAFYVVSRFVNNKKIKVEELTDEFFDYVFLGKGKAKNKVWEEIRKEFDYWYPVDINLGGKEHQTVHFPVYIMNHVAIFNSKDWPKGIFVNFWVTGKGGKISKSKGGASASPMEEAKRYSVDGLRLYYAHIGSPHSDIEWDEDKIFSYKNHVEKVYGLISKVREFNEENSSLDKWLISKFNTRLKNYIKAMDNFDLRGGISEIFFEFQKDLSWYINRGGKGKKVIKLIEDWLKCLTPFIPFTAEENWEILGNKELISIQNIPVINEKAIDPIIELSEEVIYNTEQDITNVIKLSKIENPKGITLFIAPQWKRDAWKKAKLVNKDKIINELMKIPELKSKEGASFAQYLQKKIHELGEILSEEEEYNSFKNAEKYLKEKFNTEIKIILASESEHPKAKTAMPGKPALLVE